MFTTRMLALTRKTAVVAVVPAALFCVAPFVAAPADAAPASHKVWVCKYIHAPGLETEVLKAGKQPIAVDRDATVGELFKDGQHLSLVLDEVTEANTSHPGNDYTGSSTCAEQLPDQPADPTDPTTVPTEEPSPS